MTKTFNELAKEITDYSYLVRYDNYELTQETELGGTIVLMNIDYHIYIDINDFQSEFNLSTYKYDKDGILEDIGRNVKSVKSLKAIKSYLDKFTR